MVLVCLIRIGLYPCDSFLIGAYSVNYMAGIDIVGVLLN